MFRNPNRRSLYYGSGNNERLFGVVAPCMGIIFCSFVGCALAFMGIVITSVAYTSFQNFPDNSMKIVGPIFLSIGLFVVCAAIGLLIFTIKKRRRQEPQAIQDQPAQSACHPLQPHSTTGGPSPVALPYRPPDVYDPEQRIMTTDMTSSYEKSTVQASVPPGSDMRSPLEQPSYNPYYAPPAAPLVCHPVEQLPFNPNVLYH